MRWYRLAATRGDPRAQNNLGSMYYQGMGVPKDMAEAAKSYRLSAEQGHYVPQFNLAVCLLNGYGVQRDGVEAAAWLHKSAAHGHIGPEDRLDSDASRQGVGHDPPPLWPARTLVQPDVASGRD